MTEAFNVSDFPLHFQGINTIMEFETGGESGHHLSYANGKLPHGRV